MTHATLLVGDSQSNKNLFFKTKFLAGDPFVYLETDGRSVLVVNEMEGGRARKESSVAEVRTFADFGYRDLIRETNDPYAAFCGMLARLVRDAGADEVRVEPIFPVLYADRLRAEGLTVTVQPRLFSLERRAKSREQIEAIERAQRATERAMARAMEILSAAEERDGNLHLDGIPLTSERLRSEVELSLMREGLEVPTPIVAGGPGAADPHWEGYGPLRSGEPIIIDIFPRDKRTGYYADMTRTFVKGRATDVVRAMYDATSRALDAALGEIRAGASGRTVHEAVRETYAEAGFDRDDGGPRFIHSTGHGVGLDIHEAPGLGMVDVELIAGDAVTVEPGLYDPAVGGVRIEDLVVVTADGYHNLTDFPRHLEL